MANLAGEYAVLPEWLGSEDIQRRLDGLEKPPVTIPEFEAEIGRYELPAALTSYLVKELHAEPWVGHANALRIADVQSVYGRIRRARGALYEMVRLIKNEEIGYLRECKVCGQIFFASRKDQWGCTLAHSKKQRQEKWRATSGYQPKPRPKQPRRLASIRRSLERWSGEFNPTYENLKELAAQADVTVKECEAALEFIEQTKVKTPMTKKRAETARKR